MRAVVQRVTHASVLCSGHCAGSIGRGLLVLLGVERGDTRAGAEYLAKKIFALRVFDNPAGRMDLTVGDIGGGLLVVSQFTLLGNVKGGNRPDFTRAAPPEEARALYDYFLSLLSSGPVPVSSGVFGGDMQVELCNDGPVTLVLDSPAG